MGRSKVHQLETCRNLYSEQQLTGLIVKCLITIRFVCKANTQEYDLELDHVIGASYVTKDCPGDLVLGQMDEEFYEDPDLRDIFKKSLLDEEKMKPFEDAQKIYIVTRFVSGVYVHD